MIDKTIRIKLKKLPLGLRGYHYRIVSMTNAVFIDTGYVNKRRTGDLIDENEAENICCDRRTEVSVS